MNSKNKNNSSRPRGTTKGGYNFSQSIIQDVWSKGKVIPFKDPNLVRADACGAEIHRHKYGDTSSVFGWEIDHIIPVEHDGSDEMINLQPMQWQNNRHKGDSLPTQWSCEVTD